MEQYAMNNKETLAYVRSEAKKLGLTLKESSCSINGCKAYHFIERGNKYNVIVDTMTLEIALKRVCSGELKNLKGW